MAPEAAGALIPRDSKKSSARLSGLWLLGRRPTQARHHNSTDTGVGTGADLPGSRSALRHLASADCDPFQEQRRNDAHGATLPRRAQVPCKTVPGIAELIGVNGSDFADSRRRHGRPARPGTRAPFRGRYPRRDSWSHSDGHGSRWFDRLRIVPPVGAVSTREQSWASTTARPRSSISSRKCIQSFPEVPFIAEIGNIQNGKRIQHVLDEHEPSVLYPRGGL